MAKKIAELLIKIGADTYGFEKMSGDVKKQLDSLQKDLQGFGKKMSLYFTAPMTAVAGASVKAADVQLKNEKRLLTALRGREDVQKRLIKQAGELQSRSLFGDEEIIGQQAYLAALGLTEQQINDTIEASAQLASATGMTLDSAVKNLAKTYGGLAGELGESIPKMKELTVEQMKNGEAVKFVLENYKGFAETASATGLGPMQQLKNAIGGVGEEIGKVLMPYIQAAATALKGFAEWFQKLPPWVKTTAVAVGALAAAIGPATLGLSAILKILPSLKVAFAALTGPVGLVTTAIAAATTAIIGFNAAKKQAFSDAADELVEKWRDGDYTPEQLADLRSRKESRIKGLKDLVYYDQRSNVIDPDRHARIRSNKEKIAQLEIEIEAINRLIEIKKAEAAYQNQTTNKDNQEITEQLGLIEALQKKISDLETAKSKATGTYEIHNLTLQIKDLRDELSRLESVGSVGSVFQGRHGLFGGVESLKFDPNAINPPESNWKNSRNLFSDGIDELEGGMITRLIDLGIQIKNVMSEVGISIGEGLGNMISGDGAFDDLAANIATAIGNLIKNVGRQLVQLGVEMLAIRQALAAAFTNPFTAIAAGIAAIAAGQALINAFKKKNEKTVALAEGGLAYGPTMALVGDNRGAGSDPEVIAPLSKLRQYGLGRQTIEFIGGTFRLSGSDLLLSVNRQDAKIAYANGI